MPSKHKKEELRSEGIRKRTKPNLKNIYANKDFNYFLQMKALQKFQTQDVEEKERLAKMLLGKDKEVIEKDYVNYVKLKDTCQSNPSFKKMLIDSAFSYNALSNTLYDPTHGFLQPFTVLNLPFSATLEEIEEKYEEKKHAFHLESAKDKEEVLRLIDIVNTCYIFIKEKKMKETAQ